MEPKISNKILPPYSVLPLLLTALSMLCSYGGAKLWQLLFGFPTPADLSLPFDLQVPFLPFWGWIYIGSYFFWIYVYITAARSGKDIACKLAVADVTGKLISFVFFVAFPTTNVRPVVSGDGLTPLLMRTIYTLDTPTNLFPSLHCFVPWLGTRCIFSAENLKHKGSHCLFSLIGTLLVFASTLLTKQHVAVDILGGIAVAEIGLLIARFSPLSRLFQTWNETFINTKLCKFLSF